jgi:hypothetical protein
VAISKLFLVSCWIRERTAQGIYSRGSGAESESELAPGGIDRISYHEFVPEAKVFFFEISQGLLMACLRSHTPSGRRVTDGQLPTQVCQLATNNAHYE